MLQGRCHTPAFRPYTVADVLGCELGGAYKNVVALAVGMAVGLGFGDNTTASVITRGLAETARLAIALGANPLTLMGLAGLGDLVATCSSPLSRNRTFGEKLGQGMTTEEIIASTRQVAEGVKSCSSLLELAERTGVDAPIAEHVDAVVAGRMTAQRDDGRVHRPRHQGRDGLSGRTSSRALRDESPLDLGSRSRSGQRLERLLEVVPEVVDVLDADRQPDQARRGWSRARSSSGGAARTSTRRRRGWWRAPRAGLAGEQVGGHRALRQHDRDDAAEPGVADLGDRRVLAEAAGQLLGVGLGALDAAGAGCAGRAARARPRTARARPGGRGAS